MKHMPRIVSETGQPPRLKLWMGVNDLTVDLSMGDLRNLASDALDILMREMRRIERETKGTPS